MIHTIGDSHCKFGFEKINNINIHWLGPKCCYSFGKNKLQYINIRDFGIQENDTIIFSLGEIDCRAHIYKFVTDEISFETIIDTIVENYFIAIKENIAQYNHLKTVIYNIVPPTDIHNKNIIHTEDELQKHVYIKHKDDFIPWKGPNDDRKKYHLYFNKKLQEYCQKNHFIFFDIYNKYTDENGYLDRKYSDGDIHINNPIYITEFLQQLDPSIY